MPFAASSLGSLESTSQIRLTTLIDSLPVGLVLLDEECMPLLTNSRLLHLLNYDSEKNVVQQLNDSFDLQAICAECRETNEPLPPREIRMAERYLQLMVTPIRADGQLLGMVMLVEDITEKEILKRAREEFFAVASHELRTPLTAIRGNSNLILQYYSTQLDADLMQTVRDIYNSSIRLIGIVNDFLDASKLELGRMRFAVEPVELMPLVEEVVRELAVTAREKGLRLEADEITTISVMADPARTKQVLINLIGNAVKFTRAGGVTVTATPRPGWVDIRVVDTGPGISAKNQNLLFRKFQQAGTSILARDMTQGTGMGLYVSRLVAEGMGGALVLERSALGVGTTFLFTLPTTEKQ